MCNYRFIPMVMLLAGASSYLPASAATCRPFISAPSYALGAYPNAVAEGDFNGDGILDVVAADRSGYVDILLGRTNGTFSSPSALAAGALAYWVAVGDFNNDGRLDIAVANAIFGTGTVTIFLGNGDGTFQPPSAFPTPSEATFVAVSDFNNDGNLDLVVIANTTIADNTIAVLLGNGDGTFGPATSYQVNFLPTAIAVADLNHDGNQDLAVSNGGGFISLGTTVSVLLGNGDGTFQPKVDYTVGNQPYSVIAADLNGDGKLDLAAANHIDGTVSVLLGNGDGTFQTAKTYTAGVPYGPYVVVAMNFDGNGKLPGLVVGGASGTWVLINNGDGTLHAGGSFDPDSSRLVVGDFNRDGKPDIAELSSNGLTVLFGKGHGVFMSSRDYVAGPYPGAIASGDFNGDGKLDLATANPDGYSINILLGDGSGHFHWSVSYTVPNTANPSAIAAGDLNGDGILDLAVTLERSSSQVLVLLGDGHGGFQPAGRYNAGPYATSLAMADFNADGILDLVVANLGVIGMPSPQGSISILLGNGDGTFQPAVTYNAGGYARSVVVADFNSDGRPDVAVVNSLDNTASVFLNHGDGTFQSARNSVAGSYPVYAAVSDFNHDGIPDLAVADVNNGVDDFQVDILLGNGDGSLQAPIAIAVANSPAGLAAVDLNGDGNQDLAVSNSGIVSLLFGNGDGTFGSAGIVNAGGAPGAMAVGDWNRDGLPDLAVVEDSASSAGVLLNRCAPPPLP